MTNAQFKQACELAFSYVDLSHENDSVICGFGLPDFEQVYARIGAVAKCIRWQCCQLNGGVDGEALEECRRNFRHKVIVC